MEAKRARLTPPQNYIYQTLKMLAENSPAAGEAVTSEDLANALDWLREQSEIIKGLFTSIILTYAVDVDGNTDDYVYGAVGLGVVGFRLDLRALPATLQRMLVLMPRFKFVIPKN